MKRSKGIHNLKEPFWFLKRCLTGNVESFLVLCRTFQGSKKRVDFLLLEYLSRDNEMGKEVTVRNLFYIINYMEWLQFI